MVTLPFKTYTGGVIALECRLGDNPAPLNFILDSGSGGISLDSSTVQEFQIPIRATDTTISGIAGIKKVPFSFDRKLFMGTFPTEHVDFYVNDYSLLSSTYGEKIDGIIGYGLLSRYIFNIDFDSAQIRVYRPGSFIYDDEGAVLHPSLLRLAAQKLTIRDRKKTRASFYMDTGAGLCLLLSEKFVKDSSVLLGKRKPVITQAEGLGGKKAMRLTVIKQVKIGPYQFKNVPVHLYSDDNNILSYPYTMGLLGNDLMRRFNITFNYPAGVIHIVPNTHFYDSFDYAYTGMSLYSVEEDIVIDDIEKGSPADLAGLKNGDILISVGGNVSGNVQQYKNLLQNYKEPVRVLIKRKEVLLLRVIRAISIR